MNDVCYKDTLLEYNPIIAKLFIPTYPDWIAYTAGMWDLIKTSHDGGEVRERHPEKSIIIKILDQNLRLWHEK